MRQQGGLHRRSGDRGGQRDKNFQGFGRFTTGSQGRVPLPHHQAGARTPAGTPHIHFKVKKGGRNCSPPSSSSTAIPQNRRDGVFRGVRDPFERELVLVDFKPIKDSKIGELSARFDIVVGLTPADEPGRKTAGSEPLTT